MAAVWSRCEKAGHVTAPSTPGPETKKALQRGPFHIRVRALIPRRFTITGVFHRVGLEAGPMALWLYGGLAERGLPAVVIEVRQMKAFAKASPIKTDKRDARLIVQAIRTGLLKATHVKTDASQRLRLLLRDR